MYTHIKKLIRLAAFAGLIVPPTALAAIALQLPVDAIAGLGFDALLSGAGKNQTIVLDVSDPEGNTESLRARADENGDATITIDGKLAEIAGMYQISTSGAAGEVDVIPDVIDPVLSSIDVWTPRIDDNGDDAASVTVTLVDQYGNPLSGRIATLLSSRSDDEITAESSETDENGEQHFSLRTYEGGTISLRAIDLLSGQALEGAATIRAGDEAMGGPTAQSASRSVRGDRFYYAQVSSFDVIDHFEIAAPDSLPVGEEASKITISAVDQDGNTVEDYVGTVVFSSTDPDATLPNFGRYTFKDRDLGQKDFPLVLTFRETGEQTFQVEDENDRTIFGKITVDVGGTSTPGGGVITITSPKDGGTVGSSTVTIEGKGPAFTNLVVLGGIADTPGATDGDGRFAIPVMLRADQRDFTIRVQDEDGRHDSGPILLHLDNQGPQIGAVTFTPPIAREGDKVLVVVKSEAGLASMHLTITHSKTNAVQDITLSENASSSGTYQSFFTAPVADTYQPTLIAIDDAGNKTELRSAFTVGIPALPVVTGVAVTARANAVEVKWSPLSDDVDAYRVYVGEKEGDFGYSLDTPKPTDSAMVAGLTAGKTYYFAVTAIEGERESAEKSDVVTASPLGLTLEAIPGDQSLLLRWSELDAGAPLAHFLLEYGLDVEALTEQRLINRELTEYTLGDLLNNVQYVIRITPVAVNGKKLTDLSATVTGTPNGAAGFHPSAGDPIPFDPTLHPGAKPHIAPETPASGITSMAGWIAAIASAIGCWMYLQRRAERRRTAAFLASLPTA